MKAPVVDYRRLRLSNITSPEYRHVLLLLGWVGYFCLYFLTENLIPPENCYPVHCALDDLIPFAEIFVVPYVFWYVLIVISLLWFLLYNPDGFQRLQTYIIITQVIAMLCYTVFPTRQDLRPESFRRENVFTWMIGVLYDFDTNTGVCPSLHVAYSMGIASVWLKEKQAGKLWKGFVVVSVVFICLATMFIKQHSAVDFFAALPVCLLAEFLIYGRDYWLPRMKNKSRQKPADQRDGW